mmetsp:Transcript_49973/g.124685  ORF Transcript_49973/g.124685 Transcript_49973/m.124685 type:complete len:82 (-) Transcript_49973:1605-1850(-)
MTMIWSAPMTVLSRCAMTMVVLPCINVLSAPCTKCSVRESSALVASSSSSILGFLISALAIATRCFCPPETLTPFSPGLAS